MDQEVVVVANCSASESRAFEVIVDITLNQPADQYHVRYSNKSAFQGPGPVQHKPAGSVAVQEADGGSGSGPLRSIRVSLAPLEVQILSR
jgi:hypothetical protein